MRSRTKLCQSFNEKLISIFTESQGTKTYLILISLMVCSEDFLI